MMNAENRHEAEQLMSWKANNAKSELMELEGRLYALGAIRQAKALGTIIGKLETWQHTI